MAASRVKFPIKVNAWVDKPTSAALVGLLEHPYATAHAINASDIVRESLDRCLPVIRAEWDEEVARGALDERTVA